MSHIVEDDAVLSAALDGIPKIAERIANVSPSVRSRALEAAEQSYLQTARALGYDELDAQLWASTVMAQLQITEGIENLVGQIANDEPSLIPSPVLEIEEPEKGELRQQESTVLGECYSENVTGPPHHRLFLTLEEAPATHPRLSKGGGGDAPAIPETKNG